MSTPLLSDQMREGSSAQHRSAEQSPFIGALFRGQLPLPAYLDYLRSLLPIYRAMEKHFTALQSDAVLGAFYLPELHRAEALQADLDFWREQLPAASATPYPAVDRYAASLDHYRASWPVGLVAHHYTRYLGDLSGGQMLGGVIAKNFHLSGSDGLRFYQFAQVADPGAFKTRYRELLNQLPLEPQDQARLVGVVQEVFQLNIGVFTDLSQRWLSAGA